MTRGRPPFRFILIDTPSDHEVDNNIVRECQVIQALLHNRNLGTVTKVITGSSVENFKGADWRPYPKVGFAHVAAHGGNKGIGLIGGEVGWGILSKRLKLLSPKLSEDQLRILCISCCYSENAFQRLQPLLSGHFTHAYYFAIKKVTFSTAMTVWSMFYRKKTLDKPLKAVVDPINKFFGRETIAFDEF